MKTILGPNEENFEIYNIINSNQKIHSYKNKDLNITCAENWKIQC